MAYIKPFKGLRYNLEKTMLKQVIAPPYDIISKDMREALEIKSPYNIVKLILPEGENKYAGAAHLLDTWQSEEILLKDELMSFYLYEQEYEFDHKRYSRIGFIGLAKIEEFKKNIIMPHEKILSTPVEDRFNLLRECKANLSSVFSLYLDNEKKLDKLFYYVKKTMPSASAVDDDGVKNTIWVISEEKDVNFLIDFMKDKKLYIADGHHRYTTALNYMKMMREMNHDGVDNIRDYDFVMMMFVNFYDDGLKIFPTHRVIDMREDFNIDNFMNKVKKFFDVKMLEGEGKIEEFFSDKAPTRIIIYFESKYYGIVLKDEFFEGLHPIYRKINTFILHEFIIKNCLSIKDEDVLKNKGINFVHNFQDVKKLCNVKNTIGFLLPAVNIDVVREIAENNLTMPQKSTYFYPKLSSGLVIYKHR